MSECEQAQEHSELGRAIAALEAQRAILGDAVVDASIAALREKLAALSSSSVSPTEEGLQGERRLATVLLADVKGSTALAERIDAETWVEIMNRVFQILGAEIYRYGGHIDQYRGDGLVAFFGLPTAHEDDPERALLAALAMQEAIRRYAAELAQGQGVELLLRVGVNSGEVIAARVGDQSWHSENTAMGRTVALAARMEAVAEPGTVLVTEDTYRLVQPLFEWQALGEITVKGVSQPVTVYRPLSARAVSSKGRGIEGLASPLVGRDAELQALRKALDDLRAGMGGIVTLVGEAGIGKSRLVAEVRKQSLAKGRQPSQGWAVRWVEGRCLSYGGSIAYLLWIDMLRSILNVTADASPHAVGGALRAQVEALCPECFDSVYPYLARLMSLPLEGEYEAVRNLEGEALRGETFAAVRTTIESAARRGPLVIVCEDLHWADETSLALLQRVLALTDRLALLVVCVFRPEVEHGCWQTKERAARLYRHRHTDLWLDPLSADESQALVGHLLRVEELPSELRQRILERAEGNPFYVEEIIRALIDDEAIVHDEDAGRWRAKRGTADIPLPDTLHGVLSARIDRLQEETRRVLRLASVIGRVFLYRVLAEIAREERELDTRLLILQREQLIRERARVPEIEYIFKHELTREAAYNGLLLRERRAYHRQVAQALERLFPERVDELLGTLAHHWERAGDVEQGLSYLRRAGEQAAGQYANAEAVAYFSRALDLLPEERREERFALLLAREEIHHLQGSREAQEQDLRALQRLGERLGSERDRVIVALRRARCASQTGEVALARSILEGMLPLIEQVPDVRDRAESYLIWARHFGPGQFHGLHVSRRPQLEKAVDLARAAALKDLEAQSLRELGLAFWQEENAEQALLHLEDALRLSREIGDRKVEGMTCNAIGWILSETGHDVEAQPYLRLGIPLCRETGNRYDEGWGTHHLALSHYCQGDLGAALGGFQCVVDLARVIQVPMLVDLALWGVGLVYGDLGQYAEAAAYCERVLSGAREAGDPLVAENALWYLGRQMHCLGDDEGARASGEELLDVAQAQGDMTAEYGAWVLLGHARIGLGDLDGADDAYQRALEASSSLVESLRLPPRVGLVRVALLKGGVEDLRQALPHVEGMLRHWEAHPDLQRGVPFEAFEMCWTCYRLLEAIGDPRAPDVLTKAYNLVQTRAAQLKDPAHRRAFLEDVRVHREIVAEYERRSAQPG